MLEEFGSWFKVVEAKSKGVDVNINNFIISEAANLILPFHREMDEIREDAAGKGKIGTTRRGIGPAYEDKVGRRSIRVMDLRSEKEEDLIIFWFLWLCPLLTKIFLQIC